jgi:hypothetical protein
MFFWILRMNRRDQFSGKNRGVCRDWFWKSERQSAPESEFDVASAGDYPVVRKIVAVRVK